MFYHSHHDDSQGQMSEFWWNHSLAAYVDLCLCWRGTWDGKLIIHPRNLWVRSSNLTRGQPAKLPSFGGYSLETLPCLALCRFTHKFSRSLSWTLALIWSEERIVKETIWACSSSWTGTCSSSWSGGQGDGSGCVLGTWSDGWVCLVFCPSSCCVVVWMEFPGVLFVFCLVILMIVSPFP